ncbi:MAG: hypothetical protein IT330_15090 [Anaerolineae bacterium]|nr:hypothetical protein [Anaerolineae bacterium]
MLPDLVHYATEAAYRQHYETYYCQARIYTFDGMRVYFPKSQFDDAFYESASRAARDKSLFSWNRAERIDWIRAALQDRTAELYAGWDREEKRINWKRRIVLVYGNYVVVLNLVPKKHTATFITAYVADPTTIQKIRNGPRWP